MCLNAAIVQNFIVISSADEVMFSVFLGLCVCARRQNISKSYERIMIKFPEGMGSGTRRNRLNFGGDPAFSLQSIR